MTDLLTKYAERDIEFTRLLRNSMWAGELKSMLLPYSPPPVSWRKRVWRSITTFIWAYVPRIHIGPCDHSDCYGED